MTVPFNQPNDRIFWACQAVFLEERNTEEGNSGNPTNATFLDGVQSVGVSHDNPSNSLVDIGRHQRKYTQYQQPTIDITLERVINKGSDFFYKVTPDQYTSYQNSHLLHANNFGSKGAKDNNNKVLRNYDITIIYTPDRFGSIDDGIGYDSDTSTPGLQPDPDRLNLISVTYLNCLITSINYTIGIDGVRESISLTTKNLKYNDDYSSIIQYNIPTLPQDGNILKRQDFDLTESDETSTQYGKSKLPTEAKELFNFDSPVLEGSPEQLQVLGIQSISIDVSMDYTRLTDVGNWRGSQANKEHEQNRWTILNLPVSVTCSFTGVLRQSMPYFNFLHSNLNRVRNVDNIYTKSLGQTDSTDWQEADREIKIVALGSATPQDYFIWDLGKKNYLTSIEYSGGDAGGNNVEGTLNYANQYSDFVVTKNEVVQDLTSTSPY